MRVLKVSVAVALLAGPQPWRGPPTPGPYPRTSPSHHAATAACPMRLPDVSPGCHQRCRGERRGCGDEGRDGGAAPGWPDGWLDDNGRARVVRVREGSVRCVRGDCDSRGSCTGDRASRGERAARYAAAPARARHSGAPRIRVGGFERAQAECRASAVAPHGSRHAISPRRWAQCLACRRTRGRKWFDLPRTGEFNTAAYDRIDDNRFRRVADEPVSTFSTDVDTASYSNVRRFLNEGTCRLPTPCASRNWSTTSASPTRNLAAMRPSRVTTEVAACPGTRATGWRSWPAGEARRAGRRTPARNLVFLLDVSGSMTPAERVAPRQDRDADADRHAHRARPRRHRRLCRRERARAALDARRPEGRRFIAPSTSLQAGGSTNGAEGIQLAYDTAAAGFVKGGVNRVILATDGDFNVGVTSQGELVRLIEQERERGIFLSVLGVGSDNLKDSTMEKLADRGNGNYCVPGLARRGPARARGGGGVHARHGREGRQDPDRVQPAHGRRVSPGRLRESPARRAKTSTTTGRMPATSAPAAR